MVYSDGYLLEGSTQPVTAACKALKAAPGDETFLEQGRMLTKEAAILLSVQDASQHPSHCGCPNLPQLLGVNWQEDARARRSRRKARQRSQKIATELLLQQHGMETLGQLLARRRQETRPSEADLEKLRTSKACPAPEPLLTRVQLWSTATDISCALEHLHASQWSHTDVKLRNVLIGENGEAVLVNMGLAEKLGSRVKHALGSPGFNAPEVQGAGGGVGHDVSDKLDVYAFGQLLLLMVLPEATRLLKDASIPRKELSARKHKQGHASIYIDSHLSCDGVMVQLIRRCTHPNPEMRPSMLAAFNCIKNQYREVLAEEGLTISPGHPAMRDDRGVYFTPVPPHYPPPPLPDTPPPPPSQLHLGPPQPSITTEELPLKPSSCPRPDSFDTASMTTPMAESCPTPPSALRGTPATATPSNSRSLPMTPSAAPPAPPSVAVKAAPSSPALEVGCKFAPNAVLSPHAAPFMPVAAKCTALPTPREDVQQSLPEPPLAWQPAAMWPYNLQGPMQAAPAPLPSAPV